MSENEKHSELAAETSYRVGKNNFQRFGLDINAPVFITASLSITIFVVGTLLFQEQATVVFEGLRGVVDHALRLGVHADL